MLLDKTRTVTRGKPELTDTFVASESYTEARLLHLAAVAESVSEHPIARAIVDGAAARGIETLRDLRGPPESFEAIPGGGIAARVEGHDVLVGTRALLTKRGVSDKSMINLASLLDTLAAAGKTPMLVAVDQQAVGVIGVADTLKTGSAEAVAQLQRDGLEVWMITGDNQRTAERSRHRSAFLRSACSPRSCQVRRQPRCGRCKRQGGSSPSRETASMTRRRWYRRMWALPWGPVQRSLWRRQTWRL